MPTAAKMCSAILFAGMFFSISYYVKQLFPDDIPSKWFFEANTLISAILGWRMLGKSAGKSYTLSISYSITTTVVIIFWILFFHGFSQMIRQSLRGNYEEVMDAVMGIFKNAINLGEKLVTLDIVSILVAATLIIALSVEFISRRWR